MIDHEKPMLVQLAQKVLDESTCLRVNTTTGNMIPGDIIANMSTAHRDGMLLDMQSAQVIVQCYEAMSDKSLFQRAIDKIGACRLVHRLWGLYSK